MGVTAITAILSHEKAGSIRILVINGENRMKDLPNIPTFKEKGFTNTFLSNWQGILAPAGVSQSVVDTLISASEKALKSKEFIASLEKLSSAVGNKSGAEFKKMLEDYRKVAETIIQQIGLKSKK